MYKGVVYKHNGKLLSYEKGNIAICHHKWILSGIIKKKRNRSDREEQIPADLTYSWNPKTKPTENRLLPKVGWAKWMKGVDMQTFSYDVNKLWGCNIQHSDHSY